MTGNGQLTRGAFIMNDFLRNTHFKRFDYLNKTDISWLEPSFYALYIHYRNKSANLTYPVFTSSLLLGLFLPKNLNVNKLYIPLFRIQLI